MLKKIYVYRLAFLGLFFATCSSLPYEDDGYFRVSARANSPEFPVYLNNRLCTDTEGFVGLCAKRIKSNEPLVFKFDPQSYGYTVNFSCTTGVVVPGATFNVQAGDPFSITLNPQDFRSKLVFSCLGEVNPADREAPISSKFRVTINVVDQQYTARESIYIHNENGKNFVVLGKYAKWGRVFDQGKWTYYEKTTSVEIKGPVAQVRAVSESFAARFNFYNMVGVRLAGN